MPLSDLSDEQQAAFQARLKEMNLKDSDVVAKLGGPGTPPGPIILSADPNESAIRPNIFTFESLDQMKKLIGNLDSDYENGTIDMHHDLIEDWPEDRNNDCDEDMTPDDNARIDYAQNAYLFSHSRYFSSYKTIIEKLRFPAKFLVFAAVDVYLDATHGPLVIKTGSGMNFGTVTINKGGWIDFQTDAIMTVQKMVKSNTASQP